MPNSIRLIVRVLPVMLLPGILTGCGSSDEKQTESVIVTRSTESGQPRPFELPSDMRPLVVSQSPQAETHSGKSQSSDITPLPMTTPTAAKRVAPKHPIESFAPIDVRAAVAAPQDDEKLPSADFEDADFEDADFEDAVTESIVPWARPVTRSDRLIGATRKADAKTRRGMALAQRAMPLSARAEFVGALQALAEAMDEARGCRAHRDALAHGLTALEEATDFVTERAQLQRNQTLAEAVVGHATPVLQETDAESLTFTAAHEQYLDYAQEQLSAAVAGEPVGSMALYGLGRAEAVKSTNSASACYLAALMVDQRNFLASNELGVHFARNGNYRAARLHLVASWEEGRQTTTLENLVTVHRKLGEQQLADQAQRLLASAANRQNTATGTQPGIRWTDAATFARTSDAAAPVVRPSAAAKPAALPTAARPRPEKTSWLPWKSKNHR